MSAIKIANAPVSWGILEFEGLREKQYGYAEVLDEIAATGYVGTELGDWGFLPTDPAVLRAELDRRGLAMTGAFVPVRFADPTTHEAGREQALRVARLLAAVADAAGSTGKPFVVLADDNATDPVRMLNAGRVTPEMGLPEEAWRVFARGVETIARAVRDATGLPSVFHPHSAGFVETPAETARFLDLTDPELVGIVFDTGHYTFGAGPGPQPPIADALDRFGDRIRYVHFKDCDPAVADRSRREGWDYIAALRAGIFPELGSGAVDFPAVVRWLDERGYAGWIVVEQDILPGLGTPRESAQRNRDYLRSIGL